VIVGEGETVDTVVPIDPDTIGKNGAAPAKPAEKGAVKEIAWLALLGLAIGGGIFALLMPCTYPMIPITFSFFTKQADSRGGKVLPLALTYGFGIVAMFSLIGACFGIFDAFGDGLIGFAMHWSLNLIVAIAFIYFALALFGVINLEPPRALQTLAGKATSRGGFVGVFLMGLCLVITSFTCTAPFVGSMIALSASGGAVKVIAGMAIFGLTMAIPFVVLALLPGRVKAMPRAGEWMNTLKVTLGFVELAAALKFVSNADVSLNMPDLWLTQPLFLWIWVAIFAATSLYLFGVFSKGVRISAGRAAAASMFLLLAAYVGWSATQERLGKYLTVFAPPSGIRYHDVVEDDYDGALQIARTSERLLLVNFTGHN
jgi:thiol:disulfide interchange protein DsbD